MTKTQILTLIKEQPYKLGHWMGFRDLTELHNRWIKQMLFGKEDMTLQAHRGSYKTTCLALSITIMLVIRPYQKIMFLRKTDDDVTEVIRQVTNMLVHPVIQQVTSVIYGFPLTLTVATTGRVDTNLNTSTKGATQLVGIGSSGSLTGKHADVVITDDIVNARDRFSKAERERIKLVYMELQNVRNRGGRIINTGTPWHKEDAFSLMPNIQRFDCYTTGLISKEKLLEIRDTMSAGLFSANYELKHIADEDALFKKPQFFSDISLVYDGIAHIDASYGGSDATAFTVIKEHDGKFYVYGKKYGKHVDKCLPDIFRQHEKYRAGTIFCEDNADKGYLRKEIKKLGYFVKGYHEQTNKFIKIASQLTGRWSDIYFYEDTDPEYLNEVLEYNEQAGHDDCPDSLACAVRILTKKATVRGFTGGI